jgi:hypothetical protein
MQKLEAITISNNLTFFPDFAKRETPRAIAKKSFDSKTFFLKKFWFENRV